MKLFYLNNPAATILSVLLFAFSTRQIYADYACGNDPAFRFNINDGETKKCEWLMTNARRDLFCDTSGTSVSSLVKDRCPKACNNCPPPGTCKDSVGTAEVVLLGDLQSSSRYCSWFEDATNSDYCEDATIKRTCPRACNACPRPLQSQECTLVVLSSLRFDYADDDEYECILDPIDANGEEGVYVSIQATDEQKEILKAKFDRNELISEVSTLKFDDDIFINDDGIFIPASKETFHFGTRVHNPSSRRLGTNVVGDKPILVIKVTDSEGLSRGESANVISDDVFGSFGDTVTLKSQMKACSFGKLNIQAGVGDPKESAPGVLEITIDKSLRAEGRSTIRRAAVNEAQAILGHRLPGPYQHVMIVLQGCYKQCGWAAYAYANSWLSVYQGNNYKYVGVQMHEIGHNFNLAHSGGLDGKTYTDHTGMMGNPLYSDDIGAMCFNAAKNWQLGWYDSNAICIDPRVQQSWYGTMVGIADYDNNPENHPVVVKIETGTGTDQFIAFNRATGVNRQNDQADNQVTITQSGSNGEWYSQSFLLKTLSSGQEHTIPNWNNGQTLHIKASSININPGNEAPGYAEIAVCLGECTVSSEKPSRNPSSSPSRSPSARPSLRPSATPSRNPSSSPSARPIDSPSQSPSEATANGNPNGDIISGPVQFVEMGPDFDGSVTDDELGHAVAVSKSGLRVAIAAPGGNGGKGLIRVYDWEMSTMTWIQKGADILDAGGMVNNLGFSMDMNEDGSRIVVGAPETKSDDGLVQVYNLVGGTWSLLGNTIRPPAGSKGHAGFSVAMNNVGDIIAYGAPRYNDYRGSVKAFKFDGSTWGAMGQSLEATSYYTSAGGSIAMSGDGHRLVIGSAYGSWFRGSVDVLEYDSNSDQWVSIGNFGGEAYYDRFGSDVDMSEDGTRIIVGATANDNNGSNSGASQVFEYDAETSTWNQLGQIVVGASNMDALGESVAISGDGRRIAISSPKSDENGVLNSGKVALYQYSDTDDAWVPFGSDIYGEGIDSRLGEGNGSIALDRNGQHLVVGSVRGNYYAGRSRVFEALPIS